MQAYAVFGDIHGDIETLGRFIKFLKREKNITHVFFTGDFFGLKPDQEYDDILEERERQYSQIESLLDGYPLEKRLLKSFFVPGNYDMFGDHLSMIQLFNLHHKSTQTTRNVGRRVLYGHGGSWDKPSDIVRRLEERGEQFDWADYQHSDSSRELERLCLIKPGMILSHSPIREYVNHFLTEEDPRLEYPPRNDIIYLGGHTPTFEYYDVSAENSDRRVYVVRPGALGATYSGETNELLPQTFMMIYPEHMEHCTLLTFKRGRFYKKGVNLENRTLEEYNGNQK